MAAEQREVMPSGYKAIGNSYVRTTRDATIDARMKALDGHRVLDVYVKWVGDEDKAEDGGEMTLPIDPYLLEHWRTLVTYLTNQRPGINWMALLDPCRASFAPKLPSLTAEGGTPRELAVRRLSAIEPESVRWAWDKRLLLGKLNLVVGDPGDGKTSAMLAVAAGLTRGAVYGGSDLEGPAEVLYSTFEDGLADTIRPRADASGADASLIHAVEGVSDGERVVPFSVADVAALERYIATNTAIRMVVIDPVMSFIGGNVDTSSDNKVRAALAELIGIAERYDVAVVGIMHLNKGAATKAAYRVSGSLGGFVGPARSVLLVAKDAESGRRAIVQIKGNLAATPPPLEFEISEAGVRFVGEAEDLTSDRLLASPAPKDQQQSKLSDAERFLTEALSDGPIAAKRVAALAEASGISKASLRRAKDDLGIRSTKTGELDGQWTWSLPDNDERLERLEHLQGGRGFQGISSENGKGAESPETVDIPKGAQGAQGVQGCQHNRTNLLDKLHTYDTYQLNGLWLQAQRCGDSVASEVIRAEYQRRLPAGMEAANGA